MKLAEDSNSLAQNKLLVLYIMNKVNKPLNHDELLKLVLSITDMNYFYFQQFLLDLLENKYIVNYDSEGISLYAITEAGKVALQLTENIIPGILKLKVDSTFKDSLSDIQDELSVVAEFIPESENEYFVKCKLVENNKPLLEVTVFAGSRVQANAIVNNWQENANVLYPKIFEMLSLKQDDSEKTEE